MKATKKLITLVLCAALLCSFPFVYALGANTGSITAEGGIYFPAGSLTAQAAAAGSPQAAYRPLYYFSNVSAPFSFYNQLDAGQKAVYDAMKTLTPNSGNVDITLAAPVTFSSSSNPPTDTERASSTQEIENMTQTATDALLKDYPEILWLKFGGSGSHFTWNMSGKSNGSGYTWTISTITFCPVIADAYASAAGSDYAQLQSAIQSYAVTGSTRYLKVKSIHDSIAASVTYDTGATHAYDAYGALIDGKAVCEGYAEAFKLLCDRENIPCVLVTGTGVTSESSGAHMWNYVQMEDGIWYAVDVTWDGQGSTVYHDFFLTGSNSADPDYGALTFGSSHIENGVFSTDGHDFSFPSLSASAYVPTASDLTDTTDTTVPSATAVPTSASAPDTTETSIPATTASAPVTTADGSATTSAVPATTVSTSAATTAAAPSSAAVSSDSASTTVSPAGSTSGTSAFTDNGTQTAFSTVPSGMDTTVSDTSSDSNSVSSSGAGSDETAAAVTTTASADIAGTPASNPVTGEPAWIGVAVILAAAGGALLLTRKK